MEKKQKKHHGIDDQGKKKTARVAKKNIWTTTVGTDTFSFSWLYGRGSGEQWRP